MAWPATYGSAISYLTTELDGLADAGWALGSVIDNSTALNQLVDVQLILSAAVTAGSGAPTIDVYLLPVPDGATDVNPPGATAGAIPASYFRASIRANASASFTSGAAEGIVIPPGKYRIGVQNNLGTALPATGNTLKGYPYNPS